MSIKPKPKERTVTVCEKCYRASCWHMIWPCDDARTAGSVEMPISMLRQMKLENSDWWKASTQEGRPGRVIPTEEQRLIAAIEANKPVGQFESAEEAAAWLNSPEVSLCIWGWTLERPQVVAVANALRNANALKFSPTTSGEEPNA